MHCLSKYAAMCVTGCVILASTATMGFAQHIHDNHPGTPHGTPHGMDGGLWQRTSMVDGEEAGAFPAVTLVSEVPEIIYQRAFNNGLCDPVSVDVSETKQTTNSVDVNWDVGTAGTATWAAGALFASLEAEVEVSVERGQQWTVTETTTWTCSSTATCQPCESVKFTSVVTKRVATGTVTSADHIITCQCTECATTQTSYCNKVVLSGDATGYDDQEDSWDPNGSYGDCSGCEEEEGE